MRLVVSGLQIGGLADCRLADYRLADWQITDWQITDWQITDYRLADCRLVLLYWEIGKSVSEKWGKSVVEQLSKDLQTEFPVIRGFSTRNIWRMKTFYEVYNTNEKLTPLVAEIGWVQNCLIIEKCKDDIQKEFYLRKTKQMGWSKADLIDKIKKNHFENQALAQHNFETTVSSDLRAQAR